MRSILLAAAAAMALTGCATTGSGAPDEPAAPSNGQRLSFSITAWMWRV